MVPISVFDTHCDTISRCWREDEGLDRNSGAISLEISGGTANFLPCGLRMAIPDTR